MLNELQIERTLHDAESSGKVTKYTIRQLADAGVPVVKILTQGLRLTVEELNEEIDGGFLHAAQVRLCYNGWLLAEKVKNAEQIRADALRGRIMDAFRNGTAKHYKVEVDNGPDKPKGTRLCVDVEGLIAVMNNLIEGGVITVNQ